jgi:hypothetical protein
MNYQPELPTLSFRFLIVGSIKMRARANGRLPPQISDIPKSDPQAPAKDPLFVYVFDIYIAKHYPQQDGPEQKNKNPQQQALHEIATDWECSQREQDAYNPYDPKEVHTFIPL